jgi:hypothetical protein
MDASCFSGRYFNIFYTYIKKSFILILSTYKMTASYISFSTTAAPDCIVQYSSTSPCLYTPPPAFRTTPPPPHFPGCPSPPSNCCLDGYDCYCFSSRLPKSSARCSTHRTPPKADRLPSYLPTSLPSVMPAVITFHCVATPFMHNNSSMLRLFND